MGQLKSHTRQLVIEVFKLMDEMSTILIYENQRLIGKISYDELITFLNYKKDVGDIYYHKLNFELGTALHIIREMRTEKAKIAPEYVNRTLLARFTSLALLAAVLLGLAWWYYHPGGSVSSVTPGNFIVSAELIGADKALLNLGADKNINITDAAPGLIYTGQGIEIEKTAKGQLLYHLKNDQAKGIAFPHTVRTPKGGFYEVVLTDGTKIWLNAASSVKFDPAPAASATRMLSMAGEAYFEVTHDKSRPFVVSAKGQQIQVLGTHFNVNAYSNEGNARTTLLEGSLRVSVDATGQFVMLRPGEQAIFSKNKLSVVTTKAEDAATWKGGEFVFRNMPLEDIMRIVERWYDVEVIYQQAGVRKALLGGTLIRSAKLEDVLQMLEIIANVHFVVEGRRITVTQ